MNIATHEPTPVSRADIILKPFGPEHISDGVRLSQAVGWPHRVEDWALTLSVSEGVVALSDGAVVGTALCSTFGDVAAMNMIIVDAAMRGRGLGRVLMEQIIALGGARELRLVATADGLPLYEKLGFVPCGEILQHQGIARATLPDHPVSTGTLADAERLVAMDTKASGLSRADLIAAIAKKGEVLVADRGIALLRDFGRGCVLGPVVAQDDATARALVAEAARRCDGQFLRVDLPAQRGLAACAEDLGLVHVGGGIAMHRAPRSVPPSEDFRTYALASQALG